MRRVIYKKIILIIFGLSLFFITEGLCRIILPAEKLNIIESVNVVCRRDPVLLWRQRKNLNTYFQSVFVKTNDLGLREYGRLPKKDEEGLRVICLGGSSTFGWGVETDDTYPKQLEEKIISSGKNPKAEVLNAGQIGFSTAQGNLFFREEVIALKPDVVTYSYVLNDIDRIRFFPSNEGSDADALEQSSGKGLLEAIESFFADKRTYFLFKRAVFNIVKQNERLSAVLFRNKYERSKNRVSESEYARNLRQIIELCRENDVKLVFIVMPINLSFPGLGSKQVGTEMSDYFYKQALMFFEKGEYPKAEKLFKKALDYQVFWCNEAGKQYQDIMRRIAEENNILLVDAQDLFDRYSAGEKEQLFNGVYDRIHPGGLGHKVIADELFRMFDNDLIFKKR